VIRDVVPEKIEALRSGRVPFHEPGLAELIEKNRERLTFTLDLEELKAEARIFFSCVDTPPLPSGEADLARVWSVVEDLGAPEGATLVMKSTVPVGTGETIRGRLDPAVGYVSNPEFLSEARGIEDFMHPDRIVIGSFDEEHGDRVAALYDTLDAPIVRTSVASAEMIKLASNAFLATRISFVNEIANVSEAVGADVDEVVGGMGLDRRIGSSYLRPGIGYGGSCFPKDVSFLKLLAGSSGYEFRLLNSVIDVNDEQPMRVVSKLRARLGDLAGKRIAVLGLAFKPDTNDMRDAPSLVLVELLRSEGAEVRAWDPLVTGHPRLNGALVGTSALEALSGADAAVIVTEWPEIASVANAETLDAMRTPLIIDGRNFLDPEAVRAAGFEYEGIGRA
jgi:UDPglucose 6-dehydrogenase